MLNSHPDLYVFNETHWIPKLFEIFGTTEADTNAMIDIVLRCRHVDKSQTTRFDPVHFVESMDIPNRMFPNEFCDTLGRYFGRSCGKTIWADKTPDYGYFTATLQVYWPDCKIIHLIRDGADVVRSMSQHPGYKALVALRQDFWPSIALDFEGLKGELPEPPIEEFCELWYRRLVRTRHESQRLKPGSYIEVRHEEVLSSPVETLHYIAEQTGLRLDRTWLDSAPHQIDRKKARRPRSDTVLGHFNDLQLKLLKELGYSAERDQVGTC